MAIPLLKWFSSSDERDREPGTRHAFHSDVRQLGGESEVPESVGRADLVTAAMLCGLGRRDLAKVDPPGRDPALPLDMSCLIGECVAHAKRCRAEARVLRSTLPRGSVSGRPELPWHRDARKRAEGADASARAWSSLATLLNQNLW